MTGPGRGDVVVCVVGGATEDSVRDHTAVPILEVESQFDAFARTAPADVVLLEAGCRVASGWLEALREAAYAASTTATAAALTQHDLRPDSFDPGAAAVRAGSLRLRPRIEAVAGPCVYVRRRAIELIGSEGFWSRCVEQGLAHVLADDVLVFDPRPPQPHTQPPAPPQARATAAVRRALHGLSATIDARILSGPTTGTQVHVLELISGLARTQQVQLTVIVPDEPSRDALARLRSLPGMLLTTYRKASSGHPADIVHRPFQLSNAGDLSFLGSLGDRVILTQQDLIAFHDPAYFPTGSAWQDYRQLTRMALNAADRVLFFSGHARDDALAEELVDPAHASVVYLGVDHPQAADEPETLPAGAEAIEAHPFLLCLGTDFLHKNRVFALRILERLNADHGWNGCLVFAGPPVAHGSSRAQEQFFLAAHQHLREQVIDLGAVTETEKQWLYSHAGLVVYPSVLEGFGLVPFEAAAAQVPCLWAPGSSLSELLPDDAAGILPWDAPRSARQALALMDNAQARDGNLSAIEHAAHNLTWDATAHRLLEVYRATADAPAKPSAGTGVTLTEDAARLVGPGGELPADVHRPLLALATHPRVARPVWSALKLGYCASHRLIQRRR